MTWSPISDPLRCTFSNWQGYAHAHLENYNNGGGIGIYSHSGNKPNDPSQVFLQATQPLMGNEAVSGVFVSFRNQPWASLLTRPFTGNSTDFNNLRVAVSSIQGVEKLTLENPVGQQARQQTEVLFLHKNCSDTLEATPIEQRPSLPANVFKCQLQLLLLNAIKETLQNLPHPANATRA